MTRRRIPLSVPVLGSAERERVLAALDSGWVSSAGPDIEAFETEIARLTGARHAIATVNGTAAIHLALVAAGVARGEEVVVPSLTFIGTANPVTYCGAMPVFADVCPSDGTLDIRDLEAWLAAQVWEGGRLRDRMTGAPIRAVVPVHLYGSPADLDGLIALAGRYDLLVIEDATEALGSRWRDRHLGTVGRLGCLSFNGNKIVTTGGGGMVITSDDGLAARVRYLSTQARDDPTEYRHEDIGYNYRLTSLQAALGLGQLVTFNARLERKRQIASLYRAGLTGLPLRFLEPRHLSMANHWLTAVVLDDVSQRAALLSDLDGAGIDARPFFQPLHRQRPYLQAPRTGRLHVAEDLHSRGLNLPSSPNLSDKDVAFICDTIAGVLRH